MALENEGRRIELGQRLRELRGPRPQRLIANHVDTTERSYGKWERGEGGIRWENLEALAAFHGVSTNYLLFGEDEPPTRGQLDRIEERLEQLIALLTESDEDESVRGALRRLRDTVASQSPPAPVRSESVREAGRRKSA